MENEKIALLQRIANYQMLHASFGCDLGLLNGKTGCAIFFYHYARYTGNSAYEDFAGELLNEIYEDIHADIPYRFSSGIIGIAFGISYLIYAGFVEGDMDEILMDIDNKIMEKDLRRISDYSLETGLEGIVRYALCRLYLVENKPFDIVWLNNLQNTYYQVKEDIRSQGIGLLEDFIAGKEIENPFTWMIEKITESGDKEPEDSLRWQKGLSMIIL
jgi:hypothetical protein